MSTGTHHNKKPNLVDDIRESASGLPPVSSSSSGADDERVNAVKTSTTPSSSTTSDNIGDFVADTAKQGVVKAVETGLGMGEMGKRTLDGV
ncbi:hypothetical protein E3N88_34700 [Mikania micrantha]|uniref:Uncharacterized protein n=1 Tax=Mikania micrantha TaxID=192012 RepID=A0A5N6LYW2_9ASTR|nr:hypothetical protein E3N88_34700 [Mikania micrantha]